MSDDDSSNIDNNNMVLVTVLYLCYVDFSMPGPSGYANYNNLNPNTPESNNDTDDTYEFVETIIGRRQHQLILR